MTWLNCIALGVIGGIVFGVAAASGYRPGWELAEPVGIIGVIGAGCALADRIKHWR